MAKTAKRLPALSLTTQKVVFEITTKNDTVIREKQVVIVEAAGKIPVFLTDEGPSLMRRRYFNKSTRSSIWDKANRLVHNYEPLAPEKITSGEYAPCESTFIDEEKDGEAAITLQRMVYDCPAIWGVVAPIAKIFGIRCPTA